MNQRSKITHGLKRDEVWSCHLLCMALFVCLLPLAAIARLSGWRWQPWPAGSKGYRSVVAEARHMSAAIAGTVF